MLTEDMLTYLLIAGCDLHLAGRPVHREFYGLTILLEAEAAFKKVGASRISIA